MRQRLLAIVIVIVGAMGGCGEGESSAGGGSTTPAAGAVLRFVSSARHHTLDPQKASWLHDIRILDCLFEPLLRFSPEREAEPGVAESWTVSADGLTYTFHLRGDACWSNGEPVTAGDFVFAWRRAILPDSAADYSRLLFCIAGVEDFFIWRAKQLGEYVKSSRAGGGAGAAGLYEQAVEHFDKTVGLRAVDDRTLVVTLTRPVPYFLELCAFVTLAPVPAKVLQGQLRISADTGMADLDPTWTDAGRLVSNGPYVLAQWRPDRDLMLVSNPHYHGRERLANGGIQELLIENPQTGLLVYRRKQVDWLPDLPSALPVTAELVAEGGPDVHVTAAAGTYFYSFNCRPQRSDGSANPLADRRVRRALSMAIDREALVQKVTRLNQPTAATFIPPGVLPGYEPPVAAGVKFDPQAAAALLAEAGFPGGRGLENLAISYNSGAGHEVIAQQIAANWRELLGVMVKLEGAESRVFGERLKNQDYSIARASWFGDYRDPTTFLDKFVSGNGNNDAAYGNPAYDALMAEAASTTEAGKRLDLLQQAEALLLADQPLAPIFHYVSVSLFDPKRVRDLQPNAWQRYRLERVTVSEP